MTDIRSTYYFGVVVGVAFLVLGSLSVLYYFTNVYNNPEPSHFGPRYLFAGAICVFLGAGLLWKSVPVFIPLKRQHMYSLRTCPYCGVVLEEDAVVCKKCKNKLEE